MLLRITCPRRTQLGGLDEGRGRVGASSLVIALAKLADPPASALMALCLPVSRGGGVCSLGTLMRVSLPVCPRAEDLVARGAATALAMPVGLVLSPPRLDEDTGG